MSLRAAHSPEELLLEEVLCETGSFREIVLHNDDVNTFDHVIDSLVEICDHDPIQAEQCAWIVHHNGKCSVKRGTFDQLEARCHALQQRGLSAVIQ
ncbi:MAG: ATP-dependent Clp protease adaptor ClpS [Flavobacteriales bacterium]|nr:ATP-dependent Clp protease adaptor ClpS [Flavobacteriales bacterium]MCB9178485.1 ATP-dependent Clp protease adaptor ClpS [Flavobacteriales bacterium]HPF92143.1 ATP-dependent Clp protease adaptor ClpS [Flavobacteriales bacterium]